MSQSSCNLLKASVTFQLICSSLRILAAGKQIAEMLLNLLWGLLWLSMNAAHQDHAEHVQLLAAMHVPSTMHTLSITQPIHHLFLLEPMSCAAVHTCTNLRDLLLSVCMLQFVYAATCIHCGFYGR